MTAPTPDAVIEAVLRHVALGDYIHVACAKEGIDRETLRRWAHRHPNRTAALARARALGDDVWLGKVEAAALDKGCDWKGFAWIAERRSPRVLGKPSQDFTVLKNRLIAEMARIDPVKAAEVADLLARAWEAIDDD